MISECSQEINSFALWVLDASLRVSRFSQISWLEQVSPSFGGDTSNVFPGAGLEYVIVNAGHPLFAPWVLGMVQADFKGCMPFGGKGTGEL